MNRSVTKEPRHLRLELMTRIEGEGGISIDIEDGLLRNVTLDIFEPPRLFEAFLRGRSIDELPDIVARICGICPVAHQLTAVQAIEDALQLKIPPPIRALRKLLYLGEWIESHALHIFFLQLPDLFGYPSAISMAKEHREHLDRGLRLKSIGNHIMEVIGGRSIHPVNVCVGGFYSSPSKGAIEALRDEVTEAIEVSLATAGFLTTLPHRCIEHDLDFVALSLPYEYAVLDGTLKIGDEGPIRKGDFEGSFIERQVAHSTALHSVRVGTAKSYLVGPLARLYLNREQLSPKARSVTPAMDAASPWSNPYTGIIARGIELIEACESALAIISNYEEPKPPRVLFSVTAGEGRGLSEAPRGTLYHHYRINDDGLIESAKIVPPTAQNLRRMEDDLRLLIPGIIERPDTEILAECERLIRCYDPCVSCSVHAIRLREPARTTD